MNANMIKKITTLSLLILSLFIFSGCEKKEDAGAAKKTKVEKNTPEAEIKAVAEKMVKSMKEGDLENMLSCMNADSKKMMSLLLSDENAKKELATEMKKEGAKITKITYGKVTINGDKATLECTAMVDGKEDKEPMDFVKEDGKWVLAEL